MRRIDGSSGIDVHANVGQQGFNAWRRKDDLRLAGSEADVAAAEVPLLEPEHPRVEGARGLEVRRLVVGHDASDSHTGGVSQKAQPVRRNSSLNSARKSAPAPPP